MREQRTPTLFQDLGNIARLYGAVFWMIGQRLQRGPRWEQKLTDEALRIRNHSRRDTARMPRHQN